MKLFEMKTRLTKAGSAEIVYDEGVKSPERDEECICLPNNPELEIYPFKGGKQFLARLPSEFSRDRETQVWFGGTDEMPFLVRLKSEAIMHFVHGGETKFVGQLIPKQAQQLVADRSLKLRRQGDIFAVDLAVSWEEIVRASRLITGLDLMLNDCTGSSVFGTRHRISGTGTDHLSIYGQKLSAVISGTLEAPDHRPLKLETPHVLFQSEYLWDPPRAD